MTLAETGQEAQVNLWVRNLRRCTESNVKAFRQWSDLPIRWSRSPPRWSLLDRMGCQELSRPGPLQPRRVWGVGEGGCIPYPPPRRGISPLSSGIVVYVRILQKFLEDEGKKDKESEFIHSNVQTSWQIWQSTGAMRQHSVTYLVCGVYVSAVILRERTRSISCREREQGSCSRLINIEWRRQSRRRSSVLESWSLNRYNSKIQ